MMNKLTRFGSLLALLSNTEAFHVSRVGHNPVRTGFGIKATEEPSNNLKPESVDPVEISKDAVTAQTETKSKPKKEKNKKPDGIFTPVVLATKKVIGEDSLKKVRGDVIKMHSNVIGSFVETSATDFGKMTLRFMFESVDENGDGQLDSGELLIALHKLGFTWLKEKQVEGILMRMDSDKNGVIDLDEFIEGAPKNLVANLNKLAKRNGEDLGLLS